MGESFLKKAPSQAHLEKLYAIESRSISGKSVFISSAARNLSQGAWGMKIPHTTLF